MQGIQKKSNLCVHRSLYKGGLRGVMQGIQRKFNLCVHGSLYKGVGGANAELKSE
jgi:hypothetical protein